MAEKFLLKNIFNKEMVSFIGQNIKDVYPDFKLDSFIDEVMLGFDLLSFSERAEHIASKLHAYLPANYLEAIDIIEKSLGPVIEEEELEGFDCFYVMPLGVYVKNYGLHEYDRSMHALKEMTMRFTSEWPIRVFIETDEKRALYFFGIWAQDENCHVRRLVSEGTRPRLPLGTRLKKYVKDPSTVLNLLESLKNERTRLVQRSIANSLNDIAKDHPLRVTGFLSRWKEEKVNDIDWIISHACRSLIKEGDVEAMKLMGYKTDVKIKRLELELDKGEISLGDNLEFRLCFELEEKSDLIIDYLLYFKKANGSLKAKVFKIKSKSFSKGKVEITKKHPLKEATTRQYYEGIHAIALQINGKVYAPQKEFLLKL